MKLQFSEGKKHMVTITVEEKRAKSLAEPVGSESIFIL